MSKVAQQLQEIEENVFACLQPDGAWGLSNSGLILGAEDKLLVDTFFDLESTRMMLDGFGRLTQLDPVATLVVNTHANGDHCYGNSLLPNRRIIASKGARDEMLEMPPKKLNALMNAARFVTGLGKGRRVLSKVAQSLGLGIVADFMDAAPYVAHIFAQFDFADIPTVLPTETFEGSLTIELGDRSVQLMELGPAHTEGDVIAFLPNTRTLFAGDLLFMGCHPLTWAGTPTSCIEALERLLELDPQVVVPGHGPITDRSGIEDHVAYFRALREEARPLFDSKLAPEAAAKVLMDRGFGARALPERLFVNVESAYREFSRTSRKPSPITAMGAMSRLANMA
jgi:glyoxylase-like metal-dependent hydrolase (beta-lactamase superfamily II)